VVNRWNLLDQRAVDAPSLNAFKNGWHAVLSSLKKYVHSDIRLIDSKLYRALVAFAYRTLNFSLNTAQHCAPTNQTFSLIITEYTCTEEITV